MEYNFLKMKFKIKNFFLFLLWPVITVVSLNAVPMITEKETTGKSQTLPKETEVARRDTDQVEQQNETDESPQKIRATILENDQILCTVPFSEQPVSLGSNLH